MGETYTGPVAFRADLNDNRGGYVALPSDGVEEYDAKQAKIYDRVEAEKAKHGRKDRAALSYSELPLHPHSEIPADHDWDAMQQVVWVPDADGVTGHFELVDEDDDPAETQQAIIDQHLSQSQA